MINEVAQRHGFGVDATRSMLDALVKGGGSMAQFNHPEFSGPGQWMRGGMTMVSDMFNDQLKGRIDALCVELSDLLAREPHLARADGSLSPHEGAEGARGQAPGQRILDAALEQDSDTDWWPSGLRSPDSTGAQNGVRYAYFENARRLAIDIGGTVTIYDTLDHRIGGFSQQQSVGGTLRFSSQHGLIDVARQPVISSSADKG